MDINSALEDIKKKNQSTSFDKETILKFVGVLFVFVIILFFVILYFIKRSKRNKTVGGHEIGSGRSSGIAIGQPMAGPRISSPVNISRIGEQLKQLKP